MIRSWISRRLERMGRRYNYDVGYLQLLLREDFAGFLKFSGFQTMSGHRGTLPEAVFAMASIRSALREDCGPCVQLVVDMAAEAGVRPEYLRAMVSGEPAFLPEDLAMALMYVEQVLDRDPAADELREAVTALWGEKGLISLGFAMSASKVYPTLKYALGYGKACQRVVIDGEPVSPAQAGLELAT
jgi:hypothetical protein